MKKIILVLVTSLIFFSSLGVLNLSKNELANFEDCQKVINKEKGFISPEAEKISLDCYIKVISARANMDNPSKALDDLFNYLDEFNANILNIDCHRIIHAVGYAFYDLYKEKSLLPDKEYCNYGYYHGVFQKSNELESDNYNKFKNIICNGKSDAALLFCRAGVSHGYGHSIGNKKDDFIAGISLCDKIIFDSKYSLEEENCAYGYLMERISQNDFTFNAENCMLASNTSLIRGCLTGVASLLVRNNILIGEGCPADLFLVEEIKMCYRGYGYAVGVKILNYEIGKENNLLPYDKKLFLECTINKFCSSGAGSMLGSYFQQNNERARDLCSKYLPNKASISTDDICKESTIKRRNSA